MDNIKVQRLKELHAFFRNDWKVIPFKGSKAQRKNALKEYNKLLAEQAAERAAKKAAKIKQLEEIIQGCKYSLEHDFTKFWWEVLPLNAHTQCIQRLQQAEEELAELTKG